MKTSAVFGLILALALGGCDATTGTARRIQENPAAFAALTPAQKQNIERGLIEIGYTADMVYLAMGRPQKVREKTLPQGRAMLWVYENFVRPDSPNLLGFNTHGHLPHSSGQVSASTPRGACSGVFGPEPTIDGMPELQRESVYVFLLNGVVVELKAGA